MCTTGLDCNPAFDAAAVPHAESPQDPRAGWGRGCRPLAHQLLSATLDADSKMSHPPAQLAGGPPGRPWGQRQSWEAWEAGGGESSAGLNKHLSRATRI